MGWFEYRFFHGYVEVLAHAHLTTIARLPIREAKTVTPISTRS